MGGVPHSDSKVSVIVDNLSIKIKGKNIVVDDETVQISGDGKVNVAEFERDVHALCAKGEPLTAEVLNKTYMKLIRAYFGPKVVKDKQIAYEWMRIPHFYSGFYVYKYATCISAASAIVKRIETEGDAYVGQYIEFLKCGGSKSPLDSLKVAGIDMTDPTVVDGAIEDFASAIASFREIYNKK